MEIFKRVKIEEVQFPKKKSTMIMSAASLTDWNNLVERCRRRAKPCAIYGYHFLSVQPKEVKVVLKTGKYIEFYRC